MLKGPLISNHTIRAGRVLMEGTRKVIAVGHSKDQAMVHPSFG
jgi:hypothetical protein